MSNHPAPEPLTAILAICDRPIPDGVMTIAGITSKLRDIRALASQEAHPARPSDVHSTESESQSPEAADGDLLKTISERLTIMLASAQEHRDGEWITGYTIKTGALHSILGLLAGAGHPVLLAGTRRATQ